MRVSREQISAWLDGELPDDEAQAVARAVAAEPRLAAQAARLGSADNLVRAALPLEPAPSAFLDQVGLGNGSPRRS